MAFLCRCANKSYERFPCLFLNVYKPPSSRPLPFLIRSSDVCVWREIHLCQSTNIGPKSKARKKKIPEVACGNKMKSSPSICKLSFHPGLVMSNVIVCLKVLSPDVLPAPTTAPVAQAEVGRLGSVLLLTHGLAAGQSNTAALNL